MIHRQIVKYVIPAEPGEHTAPIPSAARIRSVRAADFRAIYCWAEIEPADPENLMLDEDVGPRKFLVVRDGEAFEIGPGMRFIGTCFFENPIFEFRIGGFALHVFEVR